LVSRDICISPKLRKKLKILLENTVFNFLNFTWHPGDKMSFNPLYSLLNTIKNIILRKIHFPKTKIGKILVMEDGQEFTIFREVNIDLDDELVDCVVFKVRFLVENMKPQDNIRFSVHTPTIFCGTSWISGQGLDHQLSKWIFSGHISVEKLRIC
jgi:hypothetical protein